MNPVTFNHAMKDGRCIQFFFNEDTGLVVVDVIDADEKGGVEIVRMKIPAAEKIGCPWPPINKKGKK